MFVALGQPFLLKPVSPCQVYDSLLVKYCRPSCTFRVAGCCFPEHHNFLKWERPCPSTGGINHATVAAIINPHFRVSHNTADRYAGLGPDTVIVQEVLAQDRTELVKKSLPFRNVVQGRPHPRMRLIEANSLRQVVARLVAVALPQPLTGIRYGDVTGRERPFCLYGCILPDSLRHAIPWSGLGQNRALITPIRSAVLYAVGRNCTTVPGFPPTSHST